ncbi:MAG: phosphatidylserine/phosphatidylglycerophosphate/cardiolipin synthase-like enzyme [Kiritimatiellia bacterium]|jgi:phosphatidylserine/phosphatidylglycerophosphate/cardiolipin synthase-like enzyme
MRFLILLSALVSLGSPTMAAASPAIDLIMNDPTQFDKPLDDCSAEHCKAALRVIDGAKETLDVAIYGMRNQTAIFDALVRAKKRGVTIRIVVDKDVENVNYYSSTPKLEQMFQGTVRSDYDSDLRTQANKKAYDPTTARCKNPVGFDGPAQCLGYDLGETCLVSVHAARGDLKFKGDIMHNKYMVADQQMVWMGSTNLSDSGTGGYNANLVVVFNNADIGRWFTEEFHQMYELKRYHGDKHGTGERRTVKLDANTTVDVLFSPQDSPIEKNVRPLIQRAKREIDIAVFFLTNKGIAGDLIAAHQRGVKVRVLLDATSAKNGYTKHEILRAAGIPVKIENWGGKMHMKSAVIDDFHTIVGSMNWTSAGDRSNDENTAIIHSKAIASEYSQSFEKMWRTVPDKWLAGRPDPESLDSTTSCFDGVDNDFDHAPDSEDPGCSGHPPALPDLPPHTVVPKGDGNGLIKAIVKQDGYKIFYSPQSRYYTRTLVDEDKGGRWFCSEGAAWDAGFRRSRQ